MEQSKKVEKILILSTAYHPFVGGAEIAIKEITDRVQGYEFDLITAKLNKNLPTEERIGGIMVYRLGFGKPLLDKLTLPFWGAYKIWKLESSREYSSIWAMMVSFSSISGYIFNFVRFISRKKRIPIILTLQEGDSEDYLRYKWAGLIDLSWRLALSQTYFLTAISNFLLNRAIRRGFKGESALIPNGVNLKLFSEPISQVTKDELKKNLNKKDGDIFLVTTSRLTHKNAVDDIISALVSLPTNISLVVIGMGDEGVKLQKQVYDLGLRERVKFLGFVDYSEIPKYLSICDIFIRPSRSEGFGNSFIEAMAAKIPVIATPVGGIPDFIDDKETGIFCSPDNPQSIVSAVKTLLGENQLRSRIVQKALERVTERYGWDQIAREMKGVFDKFPN